MPDWRARIGVASAFVVGTAFFGWYAGPGVLRPTSIAWTMQLDWHIHFLGWHFFRNEPWHWPPGLIENYFHPVGTSIGFTDSIPLIAFALKPISVFLPVDFQYLGLWMMLCFALQAAAGAALTSLWTSRVEHQLLGGVLFVVVPTLIARVGAPALCGHFLLVFALALYFKDRDGSVRGHLALGTLAGLIHPYLAMMTLAILFARAAARRQVLPLTIAVASVLVTWWLSGMLGPSDPQDLAAGGFGVFAMNVLGPITPNGWSTLVPDFYPVTTAEEYESLQYFGAGWFVLLATACSVAIVRRRGIGGPALWPLVAVCMVLSVFALGPVVTAARAVLIDYRHPLLEPLSAFRMSGRFFWPAAYTGMAVAVAMVVIHLPRHVATSVLALAVAVQIVDIREGIVSRHVTAASPQFHRWRPPSAGLQWPAMLAQYDHLVFYPPEHCGAAPPIAYDGAAYLAATLGKTINAGVVARPNMSAVRAYCRRAYEQLEVKGQADPRALYLVAPPQMKRILPGTLDCTPVENYFVCITAAGATGP